MMSTTEIGWDFIPPERHFQSPQDLKEMLNLYLSFGLEDWETAPGIKPPKDKFEIVRHTTKDGEKLYLWPTALTHSYLLEDKNNSTKNACHLFCAKSKLHHRICLSIKFGLKSLS